MAAASPNDSSSGSNNLIAPTFIDLCDNNNHESPNTVVIIAIDDDDDDFDQKEAAKKQPPARTWQQVENRHTKRPRGGGDSDKKNNSKIDAIDVDKNNDETIEEEEEEGTDVEDVTYRRVVGPNRMEFIEQWHTPHTYDCRSIQQQQRKTLVTSRFAAARALSNNNNTSIGITTDTTKIYKELVEYQINLPISKISSIFVRAQGSRVDLVRACITGPHGTPYAMGCFFFDLFLQDYPRNPPKVSFLTTHQKSVRFNPNLYQDGKVCLSLLGTWSGPGWVPNQSTLLQVLVSIQGLILVEEPYYNEPGYERDRGTPFGQQRSDQYSATIRNYTLLYAIAEPLRQLVKNNNDNDHHHSYEYPEFANVVRQHFLQSSKRLEQQLQDWTKHNPALTTTANQIREHLAILHSQEEERQQQQQQQLESEKTESKRKHAIVHENRETIVLLDDDE